MNAFWQCQKTCSISITIASTGRCPAGSPLGDASQRPSASDVASTQNGDVLSHSTCSGCSEVRSFFTTRPDGYPPSASRSPASVVISVTVPAADM